MKTNNAAEDSATTSFSLKTNAAPGVDKQAIESNIRVFPNPFRDQLHQLIFLVLFNLAVFLPIGAQDYRITFTGSGDSSYLDSVKVENLNSSNSVTLRGFDTLHLTVNVGIPELPSDAGNGIRIFPNPMNGSCSFKFTATDPGLATISVCNISGQLIIQEQAFLPEGNHSYGIDGLAAGAYFVKVVYPKYILSAKFISTGNDSGHIAIRHYSTTQVADLPMFNTPTRMTTGVKKSSSVIDFPYSSGDVLKLTGQSGVYRTIVMLIPVETQTVGFNFIACTDADSNNYPVVRIGTRWWMAENLKTTKYRNGDMIPNVTSNSAWGGLTTGAMSWYDNNPTAYKEIYGGLYNWYAVKDTRNLAPPGWHVPTDEEWTALTTFLGDTKTSGGKVKEAGYAHWKAPNSGATNETGFTALPGGYRFLTGIFDEILGWSVWWCSTSSSTNLAPTRAVFYNFVSLGRDLSDKKDGFAVRCIKNQ